MNRLIPLLVGFITVIAFVVVFTTLVLSYYLIHEGIFYDQKDCYFNSRDCATSVSAEEIGQARQEAGFGRD